MKLDPRPRLVILAPLAVLLAFAPAMGRPSRSSGAPTPEERATLDFLYAAHLTNVANAGALTGTASVREVVIREFEQSTPLHREQPDPSIYPLVERNRSEVTFGCDPMFDRFWWTSRIAERSFESLADATPVPFTLGSTFHDERGFVANGLYASAQAPPPIEPRKGRRTILDAYGKPPLKHVALRSEVYAANLKRSNVFDPFAYFSGWGDPDRAATRFERWLDWDASYRDSSSIHAIEVAPIAGADGGYEVRFTRENPALGLVHEETLIFDKSVGYNMTRAETRSNGALVRDWRAEFASDGEAWIPTRVIERIWKPGQYEIPKVEREVEILTFKTRDSLDEAKFILDNLHPEQTCIAVIDHVEREAFLVQTDMGRNPIEDYYLSPRLLPIPKGFKTWMTPQN
jgi:hypothetical protein